MKPLLATTALTTALIMGGAAAPTASATPTATDLPATLASADSLPASEENRLVAGSANWNYVNSWRSYLGASSENFLDGAGLVAGTKDIEWQAKPGQTFDPENPGKLHFTGHVHWSKYDGYLDVHFKNLTIDFATKQLLVDASTANTMAGTGPANATQEAIADLPDLAWEVRGNTLLVYSHTPVITQLSERIVGFYSGDKGAPFVATFEIYTGDPQAPERPLPIFWKLFPDRYEDPFYRPPLIDPDEETFEVNVPDPTLRSCIFSTLGIPEETAIVNKVLQQLQTVPCIGYNVPEDQKIKDLTGLEYARNLSWLRIPHHAVEDLSPLSGLTKLHSIDISHNQVRSLAPLAKVTSLQSITADNNKIRTIDSLTELTDLQTLSVNNNRLTSLKGLPYHIYTVRADNNRVSDMSGTSFSTTPYLRTLSLRHNRITSVDPLTTLETIESVDLRNNFISDPCPMKVWEENTSLTSLRLQYNLFDDWSCLSGISRTDVADPAWGEINETNPEKLEDLLAQDAAEDALDAEEPLPEESPNPSDEIDETPIAQPVPDPVTTPEPAPETTETPTPEATQEPSPEAVRDPEPSASATPEAPVPAPSPSASSGAEQQVAQTRPSHGGAGATANTTAATQIVGSAEQATSSAKTQAHQEQTKSSTGRLASTGVAPGLVAVGLCALLLVIGGGTAVVRSRRSS